MAASQVISQAGFSMALPFLPLYVQTLGVHGVQAAALWAGVLATAAGLTMGFMAPIWGNLADRYGRKAMVVRACVGGAFIVGAMGLVQNPQQLLVLRMVQGAVTGTVAAAAALVSGVVPEKRLGSAMGLIQTSVFVGSAVGPLVGGLIADTLGFRWTFACTGVLLFLAGVLVIFLAHENRAALRPRSSTRAPGVKATSNGLLGGYVTFALAALVAVNFLDMFAASVVSPILPLFIADLNGHSGGASGSASVTGLVLGSVAVSASISALVFGRLSDRLGSRRVIIMCAVGAGVFSGLQGLATTVLAVGLLRVCMGAFIGGTIPSANALLGQLTPPDRRGAAFGLSSAATAFGFAFGPLVGALLASRFNLRLPFSVTAGLLLLEALWVWRVVPANVGRHEEALPAASVR